MRDVVQRSIDVGRDEVEQRLRSWCEEFDAQIAVEKDRADLGGRDQIVEVVAGLLRFFQRVFERLVEGAELLIG